MSQLTQYLLSDGYQIRYEHSDGNVRWHTCSSAFEDLLGIPVLIENCREVVGRFTIAVKVAEKLIPPDQGHSTSFFGKKAQTTQVANGFLSPVDIQLSYAATTDTGDFSGFLI